MKNLKNPYGAGNSVHYHALVIVVTLVCLNMAAPTLKTVAAAAAQGDGENYCVDGNICRIITTLLAAGQLETLQALLDQGADHNVRSKDGMTPIGIAAFWGYTHIIKILLKHRVDVNAQNHGTLWTPLHCAAFQGHGPVILKLMEAKPDLSIRDMRGRRAVDFASAMDSIWPLFAAAGCKRTPMSELLKMDIIYRPGTEQYDPAEERPISGYQIKPIEMAEYQRDPNMEVAAITGDVLADTSDEYNPYGEPPTLNVYDN